MDWKSHMIGARWKSCSCWGGAGRWPPVKLLVYFSTCPSRCHEQGQGAADHDPWLPGGAACQHILWPHHTMAFTSHWPDWDSAHRTNMLLWQVTVQARHEEETYKVINTPSRHSYIIEGNQWTRTEVSSSSSSLPKKHTKSLQPTLESLYHPNHWTDYQVSPHFINGKPMSFPHILSDLVSNFVKGPKSGLKKWKIIFWTCQIFAAHFGEL